MNTNIENGEVVFLKDDARNWLVTNKRICTDRVVIRLTDVQRLEIKSGNNRENIHKITALLGVGGGVCYLLVDGFNLNWGHIIGCASPALIFSITFDLPWIGWRLVAQCNTGTIELTTTAAPGISREALTAFHNAISQALAYSSDQAAIKPAND